MYDLTGPEQLQYHNVMKQKYSKVISQLDMKPFYVTGNEKAALYKGDSLDLLSRISPESIDMIFADPPYFLSNGGMTCHAGRRVSVNKGNWDKSNGINETHRFNLGWLKLCQDALTKNGTIWVSGTAHVIYSIGFAMQQLGFKILNDIAWFKINPPPNLSCRYFTHATETVLWAAKNKKSKHYFNYARMRRMNKNKQMKSLWSIMAPRSDEKIFGKHPTQKPITLLERILLASTKKSDIVLDPFTGSSTTGIAAYRLARYFIGIDNSKEYLDLSVKRFKAEERHQPIVQEEIKKVEQQIVQTAVV